MMNHREHRVGSFLLLACRLLLRFPSVRRLPLGERLLLEVVRHFDDCGFPKLQPRGKRDCVGDVGLGDPLV